MDLFPKKKIPYPDVRFKTETLRQACEKMVNAARAEAPKASLSLYFSVRAKNHQEKTYRDQEEFFADYRTDKFEIAYASWSIAQRELAIYVHDNVTTVTVQAPDWPQVEAILSLFEEARAEAIITAKSAGIAANAQTAADFPTFRLKAPLKSSFVDKPLVEALEDYARADVLTIASLEENEQFTFGLGITDLLGTENFRTIRTYPLTKFPDGTQQIEIESSASGMNGERLDLSITFDKDRDFSAIVIRSTLPQAREIAIAVLDGLNHRVAQNRTVVGSLLSWRYGMDSALNFLISILLAVFAVGLLFTAFTKLLTWVILTAAIAFPTLYGLAKRGYPYTSFDTSLQRRRTKLARSVITTAFVVFVLGTLAVIMQQLILRTP